ncbi:MAG: cytochrome c biogenesis protein CcsA [Lacipirellulaceae bacterium]
MTTATLDEPTTPPAAAVERRTPRKPAPRGPLLGVIDALASLRLTVVLFALAIFLVFVGTLAQVDHDVWQVVNNTYFRVWVAQVEWQALARLVELFTRTEPQPVAGWFPFPGGKLIGTLMMLNLIAAHSLRFKVAARGQRLLWGAGAIALGVAATAWVVVSGLDDALEGELSPAFCSGLWQALRASLAAGGLAGMYWLTKSRDRVRPAEWRLGAALVGVVLGVAAWLFAYPDARIDDAGLRILWQLAKGGGAAAVLLAGCVLVFRKRAGIVLLHAGIGLMMVGELVTDLAADEAQMRIDEGQTANYAYDVRSTELAFVTADGANDRVTVVPQHLLETAARSNEPISHPDLPVDLLVRRFDTNSVLRPAGSVGTNVATRGAGLERVAIAAPSVSGVGTDAGLNLASAYVEALDKESGESLGVWLVSNSFFAAPGGGMLSLVPQPVEIGGKTHRVELRFKRAYKPYTVTLKDFRFDRYVGTTTPKNYSSDIVLKDPARGVDREVRIWMNNPLRYGGDTLYQSSFDNTTEQTTFLQVVSNTGWMIPYVSCMLVGLGMLTQFGLTLGRFVRRRAEEGVRELAAQAAKPRAATAGRGVWTHPTLLVPVVAALLTGGYLASKARPAGDRPAGFDLDRFGAQGVAEGGRVKPLDTLARNTVQYVSGRQEVLPIDEKDKRISAVQWLLDAAAAKPAARSHRVFRIENLEVLDLLDLPPRVGSYRYSYDEVQKNAAELARQVKLASETPADQRSLVQNKVLELAAKLSAFTKLANSFGSPRIGADRNTIEAELAAAQRQALVLRESGAPRATPPMDAAGEWQTLFEAELDDLLRRVRGAPTNDATAALSGVIDAYAKNDAAMFNTRLSKLGQATAAYEASLASADSIALAPAERLSVSKLGFETLFNRASPFYYCAATYLIAFVLTAASWLAWPKTLGRTATAVIAVTLVVHTLALVARIYISGRPPVTNLYSSAVFIGWAAVAFGLAFEAIYKLGVGNAVASVLGFSTLVVAYFLSLDGDTFTVLQAVLDTQFWLATHVVCVTLGYSTTFLAGFLAIAYLVAGPLLGRLGARGEQQVTRMTYGTLCFALFFSFIGTVLGGLWADDSWGRFWGWDPKENGALIIVLWNALVLHARWGKMVGPAGLAMLAVGGNVVTSWSWFGVNELGVGLHSYGFTDGVSFWLLMFVLSQLAVIGFALGALFTRRPSVGPLTEGPSLRGAD